MGLRVSDSKAVHNSNSDTAWQQLGLEQMPFMPQLQYAMLYSPKHWLQLLSRSQSFISSPNRLLVLTGQSQVGKTTFCNHFANYCAKDVQRLQITGNDALAPADLNQLMLDAFYLQLPKKSTDRQQQLDEVLRAMRRERENYLIVIDDAMLLPLTTLAAILHMVMHCPDRLALHVILVGENSLKEKMATLLARDASKLSLLRLELQPLSMRELRLYLKYRLQKSGLIPGVELNESAVSNIFQLTKGVPGKVNVVAQSYLQQNKLLVATKYIKKKIEKIDKPFQANKPKYAVATWLQPMSLTLVLMFCFGLWHYQDVLNNKLIEPQQASIGGNYANQLASSAPSTSLMQYLPAAQPKMTTVSHHISMKPEVQHIEHHAVARPMLAGYTVQLMGGGDPGLLKRYQVSHHLQGETNVAHTQFKNQDWYVLTYGHFANPDEAKLAIKKLPKNLKQMHPWVKKARGIEYTV